jgi:hypothetical protein
MANPNIVNVATINALTTGLIPSGTTAVVLLQNAASSGKVMKVNQLVVANVDGTNAVNCTVAYYTNGAVAQGSAPSGGTAYAIASTVSVPANATLVVIDKTTALYLNEGTSISITSGTASKLSYVCSYEEIS